MKTLVYAAKNKNSETLLHSTSGGVFSALTEEFIEQGNAVLCVHYNYESDEAEYHLIKTLEERDESRGSLYIQSVAKDSWKSAVDWLLSNKDKKLMFFGVGCQAAAFIRVAEIMNIRQRVIVVDTVCHGSPSPLVWKKYINSVKKNGILSEVNFRNKKTGWSHSVGTVKVNGQEVSIQQYRRLYSSRNTLRPCCSVCPYTSINRATDITIGDFWGIEKSLPEFADEQGVSLVLIHSEDGLKLLESISNQIIIMESNEQSCMQMNLQKPTEHANSRKEFWRDFKTKDIQWVMKKYGNISLVERIKRRIRREIKRIILLFQK